jgi:putative membrane protein
MTPPPPFDPRTALAAERTTLAWMRTGLAMMGFGFVVARFGLFLRTLALRDASIQTAPFSRWMGIAFVSLGILVCLFTALQHALSLFDRSRVDTPRRISGWIAVALSTLLALIGLAMALYLARAQ